MRGFDVAALGGAGQQKTLQHHRSEDAAVDMGEDAADVVGAEAGGQRREARVVGFCWNFVFELAAVAEEALDDF